MTEKTRYKVGSLYSETAGANKNDMTRYILGRDLYWNLGKRATRIQRYFILHIHYKLWIVAETVLLTGSFDASVCIFAQSLCSEFVRVRILHNGANIFQLLCSNFIYVSKNEHATCALLKTCNFNCRPKLNVEQKRWTAGNLAVHCSVWNFNWK